MKRKIAIAILLVPVVLLFLGVGAACISRGPVESGLVDGHLRPCPSTPNCVSSESEGGSYIEPLRFEGDPERAFASLTEYLENEPNAEVLDLDGGYLHAVYTTSFFRFADDVEFRLDAEAGVIHVRSASRVGHSDLGANRKRVEEIRRHWAPAGKD